MKPWKRRLKWGLSIGLTSSGLIHLYRSIRPGRAVILMYHRILPGDEAARVFSDTSIIVHEDSFAAQMKFLSEHYRVIPLDDLAARIASNRSLPDRAVAVTFDDGWADNYQYAFPILKAYGIPATIFLTSGFIGQKRIFWQEELRFLLTRMTASPDWQQDWPEFKKAQPQPVKDVLNKTGTGGNRDLLIAALKNTSPDTRRAFLDNLSGFLHNPRPPYETHGFLDWTRIREMKSAGISFGAHSVNHTILTAVGRDEAWRELSESKAQIEAALDAPVTGLAYPNGNYNREMLEMVRACGYGHAVTTEEATISPQTDPLALGRLNVGESRFSSPGGVFSKAMFATALAGLF